MTGRIRSWSAALYGHAPIPFLRLLARPRGPLYTTSIKNVPGYPVERWVIPVRRLHRKPFQPDGRGKSIGGSGVTLFGWHCERRIRALSSFYTRPVGSNQKPHTRVTRARRESKMGLAMGQSE